MAQQAQVMKLVEIEWVDAVTFKDQTAGAFEDDPLVRSQRIGWIIRVDKDKFGNKYIKICHNKCLNSDGNDDGIVIPFGSITKIREIKCKR